MNYLKIPIDTIPSAWFEVKQAIQVYFFNLRWNEVYDFVEFVANNYDFEPDNLEFIEECNTILQREASGYRFIGKTIAPITNQEEIAEIEAALQTKLSPVSAHLRQALTHFTDRKSPDYRNSIKESISAVEAICRLIAGSDSSLGKALGEIERQGKLKFHPSLRGAFDKLYGYTSDEKGIRHSLLEEPNLDAEEAKLMLVLCSAFVNYLKVKVDKAGIHL